MSDESYPSERNYILDFFDVISYQDPTGSAKINLLTYPLLPWWEIRPRFGDATSGGP